MATKKITKPVRKPVYATKGIKAIPIGKPTGKSEVLDAVKWATFKHSGSSVEKSIEKLADSLCLAERYHGTKNPKKPQVKIGDMREILKALSVLISADPRILKHLWDYSETITIPIYKPSGGKVSRNKK